MRPLALTSHRTRAAWPARGLVVTDDGLTVVAKAEDLERFTPLGG